MRCPVDETDLVMTDRQGIEIDYCPKCRGVWLDRGELDKIIDRAAGATPAPTPARSSDDYERAPRHYEERRHEEHHGRSYDDDDYNRGHHKKRKKEGFLGDLFDF